MGSRSNKGALLNHRDTLSKQGALDNPRILEWGLTNNSNLTTRSPGFNSLAITLKRLKAVDFSNRINPRATPPPQQNYGSPGMQQGFSGGMDPYGQPQAMGQGQSQGLGQMQNPGMNSQGFPQSGFGNAQMPAAGGGPQGFGQAPQMGGGSIATPSTPQELSPLPEEDDFHTGSQSDYADFNEEDEESEDTRFFKYGRFFGLSVGMGVQSADGNRGTLWNGGFPAIDLRLHYWFSFNFAADLGGYLSNHYFNTATTGNVDVFFSHLGVSLKYYFDLKNFSAALSFANPHLIGGGGLYHKKEFSQSLDKTDLSNAVGGNLGVGLEFAFKPRKVYLQMDGRLAYVPFADMNNAQYGMNNLRGIFYTITSRLLLTW
jgi:hypothetical protein